MRVNSSADQMARFDTSQRDTQSIVDGYKAIGLFGGIFLGGVAGIIVAGPHFHDWSASRSLLAILGTVAIGGLVGYIAGELAVASLMGGGSCGVVGAGGERGGGGADGGAGGDCCGSGDCGGGGDS